jgi:hypothetical protein
MRRALALLAFLLAALLAVPALAAPPTPAVQRVVSAKGSVVDFNLETGDAVLHLAASSGGVALAPCGADGLYGFSADQATNSQGDTLRWEFAVDTNYAPECGGNNYVRYYLKLITNHLANFANNGASLMFKVCLPDQSCSVSDYGKGNFEGCPSRCNSTTEVYVGAWHLANTASYKSCSEDFFVHFLTHDVYSAHRQRSSKWFWPLPPRSEFTGGACAPQTF